MDVPLLYDVPGVPGVPDLRLTVTDAGQAALEECRS
jgi:hypothetical protein